ncbi:MAG: DUF87 domain-containing protein, partial [bacterium]|nr:DUF87 domain-containing protein [bacterium]
MSVIGIDGIYDNEVTLSDAERSQHLYVIGKTGVGKSTLIENLIIQDIEAGRGVGFIDPHGQSARKLLNHIPPWRTDHTAYFDPSDYDHPVAFNPLQKSPEEYHHL